MKLLSHRSRTALIAFIGQSLLLTTNQSFAVSVQIGQNFKGSTYGTDSSALPADANGAAGPNNFVEFINGRFAVYDKSSTLRVQNMTDRSFWTRSGVTIPSNTDITDTRILFDVYSQHWFASQVDLPNGGTGANRFLLAASESSDPTGPWHGVAFAADPVTHDFADFPTLGVDENGVYLGADMFSRAGSAVGPTLISIPKSGLLNNPPDVSQRTSFGVLTYSSRGYICQPAATVGIASTEETVLAMGNLGLDSLLHKNVIVSTIQGAAAGNASLSASKILTIPAYVGPVPPVQPDGTKTLDSGDARMSAFVRRVGDIVYGVHSIKVNTRDAIQWFKIDAVNKTVLQSGTLTDTDLNYFYPSIAANEDGTVVLGCNGSSSTTFVSAFAFVGETVNGTLTFGNPLLLKSGTFSVQNLDSTGITRWGDYSATTLDPSDPNRFWTIQLIANSRTGWQTQITEIITSTDVVPTPPSVITQPANLSVLEGQSAAFSVSASGTGPLSYQWFFNGSSIPGATGSTLFLTNVLVATAGSYSALITNLAGSATTTPAILSVQPVSLRLNGATVANGIFSFQLTGPTNRTIIWESSNLADWIPVKTNVVANGVSDFSVPVDSNSITSFYRATFGP